MNTFRIRVTGDVLDTANATRKHQVDGELLTFGREPVYIEADELPNELTTDTYLRIDTVDAAPAGIPVIQRKRRIHPPPPDEAGLDTVNRLKSERVQQPTAALATDEPGIIGDLKSERVQEESIANPGEDTDLKSERVQEESIVASGPNTTNKLKSERVQHPDPAKRRR